MATQPTNMPVPSESPRDLKFNAGKIDEFVTSMARKYIDRFGDAHYTIEGLRWVAQQAISEFGYITMDSFEDGNTLTLPNQVLRLEATGEYYRWDGPFPKVVPSGSTPEATGGIGISKWLSVGDATLRSDLSKENGALLVDGGSIIEFKKILSFDTGGTVTSNREAVQHTDGYWYIWGGSYPKTIGASTPDTDNNWKCVGLLNGYAVNDAQNFGFTSGMDDALPALNAMIRSPFFKMFFPMGSTINIADKWAMRSFVDIDFNGSTIDWKGAILDSSNKATGYDLNVIHTNDYQGGTVGSYEHIYLRNFNIKGNDVGNGVNLRNVTHFKLENFTVDKAQRAGVNISNCHFGAATGFHLTDCIARSDLGFTSTELEAWSDGMTTWYGSTEVEVSNGLIEVPDTTRGGRCGYVVDGYSPPGKPTTHNIKITNLTVSGYDRPVHTEFSRNVTFENCRFSYLSTDKHQNLRCTLAVWNVYEPTVFINCHFETQARFMLTEGALVKFYKCSIIKDVSTEYMFFPGGGAQTGLLEFDSCTFNQRGGTWGMYNSTFKFYNCQLASDDDSLMDFGTETDAKNLEFYSCGLTNIEISGNLAKAGSLIIIDSTNSAKNINTGLNATLYVNNSNLFGEVTANATMRYNGQLPKVLHYLQNVNQQYNGMWLGTGKPAGAKPDGSGNWLRGDTVINLDALESVAFEWKCVTPGSPGRWAVSGTLGAGF